MKKSRWDYQITYLIQIRLAVWPAGEDVKGDYLGNKKAYYQQIVKPLKERPEPVYVVAGTRAEDVARRNPLKEVRSVQPFPIRK